MAQVKNNDLTEGISGGIGNKLVFRQVGNRTIISKKARVSTVRTEKQEAHRLKFQQAARYAKAKMADVIAKADYELIAKQKENTTAFAVAVGDYLKLPTIDSIRYADYKGNIGDVISIQVNDNVKVIKVIVTLSAPDGSVIETGNATLLKGDVDWTYKATSVNPVVAGTKIKAVASDRPGREAVLEQVI